MPSALYPAGRIASSRMLPEDSAPMTGAASPNQVGGASGKRDQHGRTREVLAAVAKRYRAAGRVEKGRILDESTATTGWHRKHAVRSLSLARDQTGPPSNEQVTAATEPARSRRRRYASVRDALVALWEASDRVCGKRLAPMIPALLAALERHGRLRPTSEERALLVTMSAATTGAVDGAACNDHSAPPTAPPPSSPQPRDRSAELADLHPG
jgi:hypothetical protein